MRRTFLSIAVLLLIALPSAAQTATDEMAAAAFSHDALQLTAAAPNEVTNCDLKQPLLLTVEDRAFSQRGC